MKLWTYAASKAALIQAYQFGIRHIILEHPSFSVRCFEPQPHLPLDHLTSLIQEAQAMGFEMSIQCDMVMHDHHVPLLYGLLEILKKYPVCSLRVQDIGAMTFFKTQIPNIQILFQPDIGFHNHLAFKSLEPFISGIVVGNECPIDTIKIMKKNLALDMEIQLQGLILLQYSYRRYSGDKVLYSLAQDKDYKGRYFQFLNNQHGHFMFSYFDRCLLKAIPEIKALALSSGLLDVRGQNKVYQDAVYEAYTAAFKDPNPDFSALFLTLSKVAPRPLKPGFFRANQTDQDRRKRQAKDPVAQILDTQDKKEMVLECFEVIKTGELLEAITPEGKIIPVLIEEMKNLKGDNLVDSQHEKLISLPWQKWLKAKVYLYPSS